MCESCYSNLILKKTVFSHPLLVESSVSPLPFQPIGATPRTNSVSSTITTADQREQARKVSHSAIERRRRERINDKIIQLKELIPACQDRENLHKMTILQSAIEYITYLKKVIEDVDHIEPKENNNTTPTQTKSMLPKEVEPFTHQFSVAHNKLNPPSIITTQEEEEDTCIDRNMNLENILC
ncbi:Myc-type, basic helix-loop-helix domain-containing protein [Thamnidium elegans]|nr:Myc-type, basic helix-loop-helix domain-containing protein [Thamnidium elegans]